MCKVQFGPFRILSALLFIALICIGQDVSAQTTAERVKLLEATLQDLLKRDEEKDRLIKNLLSEVKSLGGDAKALSSTTHGKDEHDHGKHDDHGKIDTGNSLFAKKVGNTIVRLDSIGVNTAMTVGHSSETGAVARTLQGGGHDPDGTGFTLQTADFGMTGSVDGYFDGEFHVAYFLDQDGESKVEVEEAFLRTNSLPIGLEIEAGQQFLEFGAFNPSHLHDWDFIDQPVILTRMFGGDGIRQTGVRLGWRGSNSPLGLHFGAYNSRGETMKSFLAADETIGGRTFRSQDVLGFSDLVYLARLELNGELWHGSHIDLGFSGLTGPNATGNDASTQIAGVDLRFENKLSGGRKFNWQSEFLFRQYELGSDNNLDLLSSHIEDYGFYTQATYEFAPKFSVGIRYELAMGEGHGVTDRQADDDRADRHRISPMLRWAFAPLGDVRLQYNYDELDSLDATTGETNAHAVWLGLRFGFGAGGEFWAGDHGHKH